MAFREVDPGPDELPEFFKFQAIGDSFTGAFVEYRSRPHDFGDGKGTRTMHDYTFKNGKDGKLYTISAGRDLHRRLQKALEQGLKPGHRCAMKYTGNAPVAGYPNGVPQFKLMVDMDGTAAPASARPPPPPPQPPKPPDDDLPF